MSIFSFDSIVEGDHFNRLNDDIEEVKKILTKIDGTAKGGIVLAISKELGLPVKYIGTGESMNDLIEFDPALFVSSILETHQVE